MSVLSQHIIQQQKFNLSFYGDLKTEDLSRKLSVWINEKLLPSIEIVFAELNRPDYKIRIDTLNIDAGIIEGEDWQKKLTEIICKQLKQKIREAVGVEIPYSLNENTLSELTFYSATEKHKLVLTYLSTGQLPWYAADINVATLMQWIEQLLSENFFSSNEVFDYFKNNKAAFYRFLLQVKPALLEGWFNQWKTVETENYLPAIIAIARVLFGTKPIAIHFSYALLFSCKLHAQQGLWKELLHQQYNNSTELIEWITMSENFINKQLSFLQLQSKALEKAVELKETNTKKEVEHKESPQKNNEQQTEYFIKNAGLIILHPFLKLFFTNIQLLNEGGKWTDIEAQKRAVLILNLIANAASETAEFELPLCKILLGYPLEKPIEALLTVTEIEEQEIEALLQSVISKWTILKTISPEGLRNSFLIRDGKLLKQDNGWLLQLQRKSIDILMEHLPWGIGIIKNSWMPQMLFTEWI